MDKSWCTLKLCHSRKGLDSNSSYLLLNLPKASGRSDFVTFHLWRIFKKKVQHGVRPINNLVCVCVALVIDVDWSSPPRGKWILAILISICPREGKTKPYSSLFTPCCKQQTFLHRCLLGLHCIMLLFVSWSKLMPPHLSSSKFMHATLIVQYILETETSNIEIPRSFHKRI